MRYCLTLDKKTESAKLPRTQTGKITVSHKPGEPNAHVSREDCAEILNLVEECRTYEDCGQFDSMMGGMATHYWFNSLEHGPVFHTDHFLTACEAACRKKAFSTKQVRALLCGY